MFALGFLLALVMTLNLAAFLGPSPSLGSCVAAGAAAGLGWSAAGLAIIYLFEGRPLVLWLVTDRVRNARAGPRLVRTPWARL